MNVYKPAVKKETLINLRNFSRKFHSAPRFLSIISVMKIRQTAESLSINTTRYCAVLHLSVTVNMILDGSTATLTVEQTCPLVSLLAGGEIPDVYATGQD